jgi:putative transposase
MNSTSTPEASLFDRAAWFDPIEAGERDRIFGFIKMMLEEQLTAALGRQRYRQGGKEAGGHRHGVHHRQIVASFRPLDIRLNLADSGGV